MEKKATMQNIGVLEELEKIAYDWPMGLATKQVEVIDESHHAMTAPVIRQNEQAYKTKKVLLITAREQDMMVRCEYPSDTFVRLSRGYISPCASVFPDYRTFNDSLE